MSTHKLFKLAARFEAKLAQQAAPKPQIPYTQLQVLSELLDQTNKALAAKDYNQLMQFANPEKFPQPGFALPGLPTYNTDQGKWTGQGSGQFFMDKNYPRPFALLKNLYANTLALYNGIIDGSSNGEDRRFGSAYGMAEYLKDSNTWHSKIQELQKLLKAPQAPAQPAATAPRTWGA
jgi:hypothetical protein